MDICSTYLEPRWSSRLVTCSAPIARCSVQELANYGEYSGAPSEQMTYNYARTILGLMTRVRDERGKVRYCCFYHPFDVLSRSTSFGSRELTREKHVADVFEMVIASNSPFELPPYARS